MEEEERSIKRRWNNWRFMGGGRWKGDQEGGGKAVGSEVVEK